MPQEDLEPLITECPSCQTRFRVSETQLERARGRVRCGACLTVFDGIEHLQLESLEGGAEGLDARAALDDLLDELAGGKPAGTARDHRAEPMSRNQRSAPAVVEPETLEPNGAEPAAAEPAAADETAGETADAGDAGPADSKAAEPDADAADAGAESRDAADASVASAAHGPVTATPVESPPAPAPAPMTPSVLFGEPNRRQPLVWAGIAGGVLLLIAQVLWYQFDDWARQPQWRSVYAPICGLLGCELPVQRDLARLDTRNLVVRSHPGQPRALQVDAVIVNAAEFPQPFPVLEMQFSTVRGNLVASRRFHPDEYLAGDAADMTLIPPRTPVQIQLTMDDPGPDAVNYRLSFR